VDTRVPQSARIWNYWLGGTENSPIDRVVGDRLREVYPAIVDLARSDRKFLVRAVTWLAREAGIRQFLDIGSGLPAADNTHQVAQRAAPEGTRVVYVDNDPVILAQAQALLAAAGGGTVRYVEGDFRAPHAVLAAANGTLDFSQPVAVLLLGVLGHFGHDDEVAYIIRRLMTATAPGSYLAIAHGSSTSPGLVAAAEQYAASGAELYHLRGPGQLERLFSGLEFVPPGVVPVPRWHLDGDAAAGEAEVFSYCAVGRKSLGIPWSGILSRR
jgi:O-methyltransferase involved in polyketide biosynthesis